jgi:quercetin dioxygenase-like cupin family protein
MEPKYFANFRTDRRVARAPGIERVTLAYNESNMLCYFYLKKGSSLPLHTHLAAQNGIVMKGEIVFVKGDGARHHLTAGDAYLFDSMDPHGSEILEDTELLESFTPAREDYIDLD